MKYKNKILLIIMLSKLQLINWKLNPTINPKTNRNIKENGRVFKKINSQYDDIFNYNICMIEDYIDIISQDRFIIKEKNKLRWVYEDIDNIIFYKEDNIIRVFTVDFLRYLKKNNVINHPISNKKIPYELFDLKDIDDNKTVSLKNKARNFFQKLSNHSIFINEDLYLNLNDNSINKLEYELKDFYYMNLSDDIRKEIDKSDGKKLFNDKPSDYEKLKLYIIEQMDYILDNIPKDMKIFSYYIIVGALSLVINDVKEDYPNYSFSF